MHALLHQRTLPELEIQQKLLEIQNLNTQAQLSSRLQLVLKQISLLLDTLPELLHLQAELLRQDIQ